MLNSTHIKTTFKVDGQTVGTTWIRRSEGCHDEAFTIARRVGRVHEADVAIFTQGHPLVPALRDETYLGTCGTNSVRVMGVE